MARFLKRIEEDIGRGKLTKAIGEILTAFYHTYEEAVAKNGHSIEEYEPILQKFLDLVIANEENPYVFEAYHERIRSPIDYYQFGIDLLRPLVIFEQSRVKGETNLEKIERQLENGENVIFLSNHQTEPDAQAISLLLEEKHSRLAEEMIFIAGQRVITDPLAIPFSMGRNLLCIYSKKYFEANPEDKQEKMLHNQRTMKKMTQLLAEGGRCMWVAPSGGRDRTDAFGHVQVAPFDPQSVEMFLLMAEQAGTPTHFYPLALFTYDLLPPPNSIQLELGEQRHTHCTPIYLSCGEEIDMHHLPGSDLADKKERRKARASYIHGLVEREYRLLIGS
jgi:glycerol-3-phosphate O-acyltransferase